MGSRMNDIVLTGVPRGGTTLACRLLGECLETVALFEPIEIRSLPAGDGPAAVRHIERFFAATRRQLLEQGSAPSKVQDGRIPDNPFAQPDAGTGLRRLQAREGLFHAPAGLAPGFTLAVKHNAAFTALLPQLQNRFETIAIVRNPLAVLASWHSLDLPVSAGRLPAGEMFDPALSARLDAEPDLVSRQLLLLDWFFGRYAELPPENVLRYEAIAATGGTALFDRAGVAPAAPPPALEDRNHLPACPPDAMPRLARRLLEHSGAWEAWYPPSAIAALLDRMPSAQ